MILFLLPLQVLAQDLTGVWTGFLQVGENKLPYELVISGEKNKLSGYSLMVFMFDGVENVGVKTMELKMRRGSISIEDGDLIYDNYNTPPKKVKLYGSMAWVGRDSNMSLAGTFSTRSLDMRSSLNENSFRGIIHLQKKDPYTRTRLTSKLSEMDLLNRLSFTQPATKKKEQQTVSTGPREKKPARANRPKKETEKRTEVIIATENQKQGAGKTDMIPAPHPIKRNIEVIQTVSFSSDSLRISVYDNGEVDGDTVSIVLDGKTIMSRVGLTARGISVSVATSQLNDSSQLTMYAENLGRIPPNTGLLILQDGTERYQIRFSGDLQNNSAISLKRRR